MKATNRGSPLSHEDRAELARRIDSEGIAALRERTGLSRTALLNAAIGLPVIAGTRALVRSALDDEDADDEDVDDGEDADDADADDEDPDDADADDDDDADDEA